MLQHRFCQKCYSLYEAKIFHFIYSYISCIGIFIIFGGYMIHTLLPAKNFIFKDPITDKYGFKGHRKNLIRSRNE